MLTVIGLVIILSVIFMVVCINVSALVGILFTLALMSFVAKLFKNTSK